MNRRKALTLSAEDRRAVDLLLDLGTTNAQAVTRTATAACQRRVAATNRVLAMLDQLPTVDPPATLVARTMARIDGALPLLERQAAVTPIHLH